MNSATVAAPVVYLWSRLVAQITTPGTMVRSLGTVLFGVIAAAAPVALLGQVLMPTRFPRSWLDRPVSLGFVVVSRYLAVSRLLGVGIVVIGGTLTGLAIAGAVVQPRIRRPTIAIGSRSKRSRRHPYRVDVRACTSAA